MSKFKPKLIVFDLDFTLWPFWVDSHVTPPFQKSSSGEVLDSSGATVTYYKEVPRILEELHQEGYILAIASRTGEIKSANELIDLFGWDKYFTYKEIYPGRKTAHFFKFKEKSGLSYEEMLFFDDKKINIYDLREEGVVSVLVKNGITKKVIEEGLKNYTRERRFKSYSIRAVILVFLIFTLYIFMYFIYK